MAKTKDKENKSETPPSVEATSLDISEILDTDCFWFQIKRSRERGSWEVTLGFKEEGESNKYFAGRSKKSVEDAIKEAVKAIEK